MAKRKGKKRTRPAGSSGTQTATPFETFLAENEDLITKETFNSVPDEVTNRLRKLHVDAETSEVLKKVTPRIETIDDDPLTTVCRSRHGTCLVFEQALENFVKYCPNREEAVLGSVLVERLLGYNDSFDFEHSIAYLRTHINNFNNILGLVEFDDWTDEWHYCLVTSTYSLNGELHLRLIGVCYFEKIIRGYQEEIVMKHQFSDAFCCVWNKYGGLDKVVPCFASNDAKKNEQHFKIPFMFSCGFDDDFFEKYGEEFPPNRLIEAYEALYGAKDRTGIVDVCTEYDYRPAIYNFSRQFQSKNRSANTRYEEIARVCSSHNSRFRRARALVDMPHLENAAVEIFDNLRKQYFKFSPDLTLHERDSKIELLFKMMSTYSFALIHQKAKRYKYWNIIRDHIVVSGNKKYSSFKIPPAKNQTSSAS